MPRLAVLLVVVIMAGVVLWIGHAPRVRADDDGCGTGNNPYNRPDGTLIQNHTDWRVYLIQDCQKRYINGPDALASYRFDNPIAEASVAETSLLPSLPDLQAREGTVFQVDCNDPVVSERCKVYIIDEISPGAYQKRYVTGSGWSAYFAPCGYGGSYVTTISSAYMANNYANGPDVTKATLRPDGHLLLSNSDGEVYLITEGQKRRQIPDNDSLFSHNFNRPVCPVSGSVVNIYSPRLEDLRAREGTLITPSGGGPVYIIERGPNFVHWKRWILSAEAFNYYGLSWGAIKTWSSASVNGYWTTVHAHPYKMLKSDTWYKSVVTNDLTMHRGYAGVQQGSWDSQITGARDAWNSAPIAPDFVEGPVNPANDVYVNVIAPGFTYWGGRVRYEYDANGKILKAIAELNGGTYPPSQPLVAHELGHVLLLEHDGLNPDAGDADDLPDLDGQCGAPRVPQTIMDYDCYLMNPPGLQGPVNWDFCGVNHKHPTGGWSGC